VVSQAANILDPIFDRGIEFHLHALLGDAFTARGLFDEPVRRGLGQAGEERDLELELGADQRLTGLS
jgi:hypothetical protein